MGYGWVLEVGAAEPVGGEDRVEVLIDEVIVRPERVLKRAFTLRAELHDRGVAAIVVDRCARLNPMNLDGSERKIEQEMRALEEDAFSPEPRRDDKAELSAQEAWLELPELEDAKRVLFAVRYDAVADVLAARPLLVGPLDEPLERHHIRRRRPHELRCLGRRQLRVHR